MIRQLLVVGLALGAAGCASTAPSGAGPDLGALTPTQQYSIAVTHAPEQILLAPHANGLSANQVAAVDGLVGRWRDAGSDSLVIRSPANGGPEAYRTAAAIQARLEALGVDAAQVSMVGYDPGAGGRAPIMLSFERYHAQGPQCGRNWTDFTHTINNDVNSNFGCAVTANLAAMVANPEDLAHPQAETAPDADRRETVLNKYRQGTTTSTAKDDQANGAVSTAVQ